MFTSLFNYHLPKELIAQQPIHPRDHSRLLVFNCRQNKIIHDHFFNLPKYLQPDDVLVFNNTKVFPARLIMQKPTNGKIEIFLLREIKSGIWECLVGGHLSAAVPQLCGTMADKVKIILSLKNLKAEIIGKNKNNNWLIKFNLKGKKFFDFIDKYGETPIPPYIKTNDSKLVRQNYQTVYAKISGSVAAPTAGFHFTKKLFQKLHQLGVQKEFVTLHVGQGTFAPVKTEKIEKHLMHEEFAILDKATCARLNQAKAQGRRVIAVGTTTARILEFASQKNGRLKPINNFINLFIYPGYKFNFITGLITNFHLPQSTLLMLVSAFISQKLGKLAGIKKIKSIYQTAIRKNYRFYSFGDGMMIL